MWCDVLRSREDEIFLLSTYNGSSSEYFMSLTRWISHYRQGNKMERGRETCRHTFLNFCLRRKFLAETYFLLKLWTFFVFGMSFKKIITPRVWQRHLFLPSRSPENVISAILIFHFSWMFLAWNMFLVVLGLSALNHWVWGEPNLISLPESNIRRPSLTQWQASDGWIREFIYSRRLSINPSSAFNPRCL